MKNMLKEDLAFADLEEFGIEFANKLKSVKTKNKTLYNKVSQPAMKAKLADEQMWRRDLLRIKMRMRKDLSSSLGEKSRQFKRIASFLNKKAREQKETLNKKYKTKIEHLKDKYKSKIEEEAIPSDLIEYSELSVFKEKEYEEIKVER